MNPPIIVTGSQRSGTTIASIITATDNNLTFVDEAEFVPGNDYRDCVIHLPPALDAYVMLHHMYPYSKFLVVTRDKADIINSMVRINWCRDNVQDWEQFLDDYVDNRIKLINQLVQYLPDQVQLLPYQSLSTHRLFVQDRSNFTVKQWRSDIPRGPKEWSDNFKCISTYYARRSAVPEG